MESKEKVSSVKSDIKHLRNNTNWSFVGNVQRYDMFLLKLDDKEYIVTGAGNIVRHK